MKLKEVVPSAEQLKKVRGVVGAAKGNGLLEKLPLPGANGEEESQEGVGDGRRLPIQQSIDVAVPVEPAWKLWNRYEDYRKFMYRIEAAEKLDPQSRALHGEDLGHPQGVGCRNHREAHPPDRYLGERGWARERGRRHVPQYGSAPHPHRAQPGHRPARADREDRARDALHEAGGSRGPASLQGLHGDERGLGLGRDREGR